MDTGKFKVIIVEDVKLELKGTEEIFRHEIPNAEVIGTATLQTKSVTVLPIYPSGRFSGLVSLNTRSASATERAVILS